MGRKTASPRKKFSMQKSAAKIRGVEWNLTFEEWWGIWEASGQWKNRGCRKGQFVMARNGDIGPYALGNVSIVEAGENAAAGLSGRTWKWGEGNIHRPARVKSRKKNAAAKLAKAEEAPLNTKHVADSAAPVCMVHVPLAPLAPTTKAPSPRVAPRVDRVGPTSRPVVLRARPPIVGEPLWRVVFRRLWNAVA